MNTVSLRNTKVTELNLDNGITLETACAQDACVIASNEAYQFEVFVENAGYLQIESHQLVELLQQTLSEDDKVVRLHLGLGQGNKSASVTFFDSRF